MHFDGCSASPVHWCRRGPDAVVAVWQHLRGLPPVPRSGGVSCPAAVLLMRLGGTSMAGRGCYGTPQRVTYGNELVMGMEAV
eukprot:scaffold73947_cov39-Tisochrysis_lutea.AAC.1